ncbi:MAG: RND family efflux transporter MFP subunit [Planctomycetota bacterium]
MRSPTQTRLFNTPPVQIQSPHISGRRPNAAPDCPPLLLRPSLILVGRLGRGLLTGLMLVGLVGLTPACSKTSHGEEIPSVDPQVTGGVRTRELPKVRVASVIRREMVRDLETMTKLESENEIEIFPLSGGVVTAVNVEEGDSVKADQVLAQLDERDEVLMVDEADVAWKESQNTLLLRELAAQETEERIQGALLAAEQAERSYQRSLSLFEGENSVASGLSRQALEDSLLARDRALNEHKLAVLAKDKAELDAELAETTVKRAFVGLERARLTLSHRQVRAPFAGVIARRDLRVGANAGTATAAFVLSDVNALQAVFARPQEERSLFQNGLDATNDDGSLQLPISATAEAIPGVEFTGRVLRISPTIDSDSGQFRVTARLDDPDRPGAARLLPGMLVRMKITTDRHPDVLVVPKRALRREGDRRFVLVVDPAAAGEGQQAGLLREVDVREGFDSDEFTEVQALDSMGLNVDDLVVVIGGRDLAGGDSVTLDSPGSEDDSAAPVEPGESGPQDAAPTDESSSDDNSGE